MAVAGVVAHKIQAKPVVSQIVRPSWPTPGLDIIRMLVRVLISRGASSGGELTRTLPDLVV